MPPGDPVARKGYYIYLGPGGGDLQLPPNGCVLEGG